MTLDELARENRLNAEETQIFREYCANRFDETGETGEPDTSFLEAWERIIEYAENFGPDQAINSMVCPSRPTVFRSPETLEIKMYDSPGGRIPIIYVRDTADFEELVTNVAFKGVRPDHLSRTGAFFLSGKSTRFIILSAKPYSNR